MAAAPRRAAHARETATPATPVFSRSLYASSAFNTLALMVTKAKMMPTAMEYCALCSDLLYGRTVMMAMSKTPTKSCASDSCVMPLKSLAVSKDVFFTRSVRSFAKTGIAARRNFNTKPVSSQNGNSSRTFVYKKPKLACTAGSSRRLRLRTKMYVMARGMPTGYIKSATIPVMRYIMCS